MNKFRRIRSPAAWFQHNSLFIVTSIDDGISDESRWQIIDSRQQIWLHQGMDGADGQRCAVGLDSGATRAAGAYESVAESLQVADPLAAAACKLHLAAANCVAAHI